MTKATRFHGLAAALAFVLSVLVPASAQDVQRRLTEASWSPDGRHAVLLFSVSGTGASHSEAMLVGQGGEGRQLPLGQGRARLLGWRTDSGAVVLETGPGEISVQPVSGASPTHLRLPAGAVPLASDGLRVYYLSEDRGHLLSVEGDGQTRVVTALPPGVRPPAALSPDGRSLALRRSVQGRDDRWATEILVVEGARTTRAATIPSATLRVAWHPSRSALLVNTPARDSTWIGRVLTRRGPHWEVQALHKDLPSPLQWDRTGRLYAADAHGLLDVNRGMRRVRDWGGRLMLWVLNPAGVQVLAGLEEAGEETSVMLLPLPQGQGTPVEWGSRTSVGRR